MMSTAARINRGCGLSGCTAKYWATTSMDPLRPHGLEVLRQWRKPPRLIGALARPVVVGAARGEESIFLRRAPPRRILLGRMAAGDHLDRLAPQAAEFLEELAPRPRLEAIAAGMREDRRPAARPDPGDRVGQGCPLVRHVRGLALGEVFVEGRLRVLHRARFHEEAREMRAAQHRLARRERERPLEGAGDSHRLQDRGDALAAPEAAVADRLQ